MGTRWDRDPDRTPAVGTVPVTLDDSSSLAARLEEYAADARVHEAALARGRERWLRQAAGEEATFAGVLVDLAERGAPLAVTAAGGRRHRGVVRAVGADFVALRTPTGRDVVLAHAAISSVRAEGRADHAVGDRAVTVALTLVDALAALAVERPRVLVVPLTGDEAVAGELRAVGRDVLALRPDGASTGASTYVPVAAVGEVSTT